MENNTSHDVNEMLPFILKRENVARYEDGAVHIFDRRRYPFERVFVRCPDVESVALAIETMVTQGGGPSIAAMYALAMEANRLSHRPADEIRAGLQAATTRLIHTRPTNTALARRLEAALQVANDALERQESVEAALLNWIEQRRTQSYDDYASTARYGADLISDGDGILTMCFAETAFILSLSMAWREGKRIQVFVPETRPYLQGARLTAPCIQELGIPVHLISDNMPAFVLSQGKVQKYFTAADLITLDGHVVNKIGTFQNAIAAHYHHVPYFAYCWGLDPHKPDRASIEVEERDASELRQCRGTPTTIAEIPAYYPAFDITPPHLVSGIITRLGVFSPFDLRNHFPL